MEALERRGVGVGNQRSICSDFLASVRLSSAVNSACGFGESRGAVPLGGNFPLEPRPTQDPEDNPVRLHLHREASPVQLS
jgi:hypothetical protein